MTEVVSVPMGCHSNSAWRRSSSSPSRITNTSGRDGSRTKICVANIRAVHIDPAELELGMGLAGNFKRSVQLHVKFT